MNENFLKSKATYYEIRAALLAKITEKYSDAGKIFTPASPYGQILDVLSSFSENWLFYLDDIANELNILLANRQESIFALSSLNSHNPTRTIAANGEISIKFKSPSEEIRGRFAIFKDKMKLRCENNNLEYFIEIPNVLGDTRLDMLSNDSYDFRIVQGTFQSNTVVGTGEPLTSFEIPSKRTIDNDRVYVSVNGEMWERIESMYDMTNNSKHFIVKSNFDGGVSLIFGNGYFGAIPALGAIIEISFVISEGFNGNINSVSNQTKFKFVENTTTELSEDLDLNTVAEIKIKTPIILGSDSEDTAFTKNIAPYASKSFLLATPNNYKHFLSRFDFLSNIVVWNDASGNNDNIFYIFLIPKILRYIDNPIDYFNISLNKFLLSQDYKDAIFRYLNESQRQLITTEAKFVDGIITKYIINVYIRIFTDVPESVIISNIQNEVANYFLNNTRRDRIPKSDIIGVIESINGVDSVNVTYLSELNEKANIDGFYILDGQRITTTPTTSIGLDDFGDILIGEKEIPVIRGDFYDRNQNYYNSGLTKNGYGCLNVFIREKIKRNR
jgi:hypothetical protein